ncbi:MAG: putative glycoside hydrolase family 92 protein [Streblomastix strix]|uniref:Putative glycoside hydrolase family 92 protein n=1 Tax=Streblomastix strix TaxID=222440 RepID=A0A5J4VUR7_9EUKA|nr:MAG: putative glycoside hydrolase family 92 protein [Streblomastix strix]
MFLKLFLAFHLVISVASQDNLSDLVRPELQTLAHAKVEKAAHISVFYPESLLKFHSGRVDFATDFLEGIPGAYINTDDNALFYFRPIQSNMLIGHNQQYSFDLENAKPHGYFVYLDEEEIEVRFASTEQSAYIDFLFERNDSEKLILLDAPDGNLLSDKNIISGTIGNYKAGKQIWSYFEFSGIKQQGNEEEIVKIRPLNNNKQFLIQLTDKHLNRIIIRYGLSMIDQNTAQSAMEQQVNKKSLDDIKNYTKSAWNEKLKKFQVEGQNGGRELIYKNDLTTFYTMIYRMYESVIVEQNKKQASNWNERLFGDVQIDSAESVWEALDGLGRILPLYAGYDGSQDEVIQLCEMAVAASQLTLKQKEERMKSNTNYIFGDQSEVSRLIKRYQSVSNVERLLHGLENVLKPEDLYKTFDSLRKLSDCTKEELDQYHEKQNLAKMKFEQRWINLHFQLQQVFDTNDTNSDIRRKNVSNMLNDTNSVILDQKRHFTEKARVLEIMKDAIKVITNTTNNNNLFDSQQQQGIKDHLNEFDALILILEGKEKASELDFWTERLILPQLETISVEMDTFMGRETEQKEKIQKIEGVNNTDVDNKQDLIKEQTEENTKEKEKEKEEKVNFTYLNMDDIYSLAEKIANQDAHYNQFR